MLRALKQAGIATSEVTLVPLTSTQFLTALQARQVDVAPLGATDAFKYLKQYGKDGARRLDTDVVDLLSILWAPTTVLQDAAKAAAIRAYIPIWAQGGVWAVGAPGHLDRQVLRREPGRHPGAGPADRAGQQQAQLPGQLGQGHRLGAGDHRPARPAAASYKHFDAATLFDRRFEPWPRRPYPASTGGDQHDRRDLRATAADRACPDRAATTALAPARGRLRRLGPGRAIPYGRLLGPLLVVAVWSAASAARPARPADPAGAVDVVATTGRPVSSGRLQTNLLTSLHRAALGFAIGAGGRHGARPGRPGSAGSARRWSTARSRSSGPSRRWA